MYLIQILLPLADNEGVSFPSESFSSIQHELTKKFGGITAFKQNPAEGLWQPDNKAIQHDDIIIFEVQTEELHKEWWKEYKNKLEALFRQDTIILRAHSIVLL